jgi:sugar O-acyltransferase (sialic acid O-acetyltransferase NeuD family)
LALETYVENFDGQMIALIYGAGAHGRTVLDMLLAQGGYEQICFVDGNPDLKGQHINGQKVLLECEAFDGAFPTAVSVVVAVGLPSLRKSMASKVAAAGLTFFNAGHPLAYQAASARVGNGCMFACGSVVNSNASLGEHVIVNTQSVVEHDSRIGDYVTISPGCQIGGRVCLEEEVFLGTGVIILPRLKIGKGAVIGAGALVTKDVPPGCLVYGAPARVVKEIDADFDYGKLL